MMRTRTAWQAAALVMILIGTIAQARGHHDAGTFDAVVAVAFLIYGDQEYPK